MTTGFYITTPTHGSSGKYATVCGLHGDHFKTTKDEARVSCRNCRRVLKRIAREYAEMGVKNVTP